MPTRADELIQTLQLMPHPEGGYFRRIYESAKRTEVNGIERPTLTAIKFLLPAGVTSRWHRVDATEVWDWSEGGAMELSLFDPEQRTLTRVQLDTSARGGQANQVVQAGIWQSARSLGEYSLMDCSVSPGFVWMGFQLLEESSEVADQIRAAGARTQHQRHVHRFGHRDARHRHRFARVHVEAGLLRCVDHGLGREIKSADVFGQPEIDQAVGGKGVVHGGLLLRRSAVQWWKIIFR